MPNYSNGKVYKIISSQTDLIYIGSTAQTLAQRMTTHRYEYKKFLNDNKIYVSFFEILKYDDAKIILIEKYECTDKEELHKYEQNHIDTKSNCCNKYKAYTGLNIQEYRKQYNNNNRDKKLNTM